MNFQHRPGSILLLWLLSSTSCSLLPLHFQETFHLCHFSILSHVPFPPLTQGLPLLLSPDSPNGSRNVLPPTPTPPVTLENSKDWAFMFSLSFARPPCQTLTTCLLSSVAFCCSVFRNTAKDQTHTQDDWSHFDKHSSPQEAVRAVWLVRSLSFTSGSRAVRAAVSQATRPSSMNLHPASSAVGLWDWASVLGCRRNAGCLLTVAVLHKSSCKVHATQVCHWISLNS